MYCPKCGMLNEDGASACMSCGEVLYARAGQRQIPVQEFAAGGVQYQGPQESCGLATAAMVLGILSFFTCLITGLPAIICGVVGLIKIGNSGRRLKGQGRAIAGVVLPVIATTFMVIFGMLAAILAPALSSVKNQAMKTDCMTNVKQLGVVMMIYSDEHGSFPTADKWCDILVDGGYIQRGMLKCPVTEGTGECDYSLNANIFGKDPDDMRDMVLLFESSPGWNQTGGRELLNLDNHDGKGCTILFGDGHVEFVDEWRMEELKW